MASLGLVKALDGFDLERGRSFIAYAAPTILGELRRHFRDRVWELRLPRGLQERTMAVSEAAASSPKSSATPHRGPDRGAAGSADEEVSEALQAEEARRTLSLDVPRSRRTRSRCPMVETWARRIPATTASRPRSPPRSAPLDERERTVLQLRFEEDLNQYEIGRRLGVSQMQVSRIMRKALRKLLEAVQAERGDPLGLPWPPWGREDRERSRERRSSLIDKLTAASRRRPEVHIPCAGEEGKRKSGERGGGVEGGVWLFSKREGG